MKKWYQSRMIWTGVAAVTIAAGEAILAGGDWRTVAIAAIGALVIVLRPLTTKAIGK